jgi:hypothetical protein
MSEMGGVILTTFLSLPPYPDKQTNFIGLN